MPHSKLLPFSLSDLDRVASPRLDVQAAAELCSALKDKIQETSTDPGWIALLNTTELGQHLTNLLAATSNVELDDTTATLVCTIVDILYFYHIVGGAEAAQRLPVAALLLNSSLLQEGATAEHVDQTKMTLALQHIVAVDQKTFDDEVSEETLRKITSRYMQRLPSVASTDLYSATVKVLALLNHRVHKPMLLECAVGSPAVQGLSEVLVQLFNRPDGEIEEATPTNIAVLKALCKVFEQALAKAEQELFYTNDVRVIYDVLLRRLSDDGRGNPVLLDLLECIKVVAQSEAVAKTAYHHDTAKEVLGQLADSISMYPVDPSADAMEQQLIQSVLHQLK